MADEDRAREVEARFAMLEKLADYDDELMEQLLEDIQPPRDKVFNDLVAEMRAGLICPVLIGSAERGNGVGRLLKAIRHEAPERRRDRAGALGVAAGDDAIVQVMKTLHTTHGGKLSVARVLSGIGRRRRRADGTGRRRSAGSPASSASWASRPTKRDAAQAGETVGLGKLDGAKTGMTLAHRQGRAAADRRARDAPTR